MSGWGRSFVRGMIWHAMLMEYIVVVDQFLASFQDHVDRY